MKNINSLRGQLHSIDGQDYAAYQSLLGAYEYEDFKLFIDQIPKDPYAPPHTGIYRLQFSYSFTRTPDGIEQPGTRRIAFRDFLARRFFKASREEAGKTRGTGYSGIITIAEPGQAILERSSVVLNEDSIEVRFFLGLPASGRNIRASLAEKMIYNELPCIVEKAFTKDNVDESVLNLHLEMAEDTEYLRENLSTMGLVAFLADGAVLPRESGVSDAPMKSDSVVRFRAPDSMRIEINLPKGGKVTGMGIQEGITLIIGGGYHGKSTLLHAIEAGIYNHIPGDGREFCVSDKSAIKIRSYSGRYVEKVDISAFISNLPDKKETTSFSTDNASGSTSQAASIQEAVEAGTRVLLMDEDTCATNFMIRDEKMQKLVQKEDEPITTFIDNVRPLFIEKGISTILVLGGIGDYFAVSDRIIQMKKYIPVDVTGKAHEIAHQSAGIRKEEGENQSLNPSERIPLPGSIDPFNQHRKKSIYTKEVNRIHFGKTVIDLTDVEQLLELSQTKAIMYALDYIAQEFKGKSTLKEILNILSTRLQKEGLDLLTEKVSGHLAEFRPLELVCAINRLRSIRMDQVSSR